jgi:hypothetical protein
VARHCAKQYIRLNIKISIHCLIIIIFHRPELLGLKGARGEEEEVKKSSQKPPTCEVFTALILPPSSSSSSSHFYYYSAMNASGEYELHEQLRIQLNHLHASPQSPTKAQK